MLHAKGITVSYADRTVLDGVDLTVADGEIVCVVGPSGCGKSTLLRVVAGLQVPQAGTVGWDGQDLTGVAAHQRRFGFVFQDLALFPHRDVGGNVAFGLRLQGWDRGRAAARVSDLLAQVGLPGYERRAVATLSGGEQQRVALARALAPSPRLLLLDEPLSALDRPLRERLALDIRALCTTTGTTAVFVTHDAEEAALVGDRRVALGTVTR